MVRWREPVGFNTLDSPATEAATLFLAEANAGNVKDSVPLDAVFPISN